MTVAPACLGDGATCANTSHIRSADSHTLTLRWGGVPLPPPFAARLDVTVTITQLPDAKPGVSTRGRRFTSLMYASLYIP